MPASTIEDTCSQLIMCRYRPRGCTYYVRYQTGEEAVARGMVDAHECVCWHRFDPPTID
jgi:hypothetical protein